MLVSKKKDMLYHDTIDDCFDVDAYWNRKEEEPICFWGGSGSGVCEVWIENNVAADGVIISVAPGAVAPGAVAPAVVTYAAAAAVDEL